MPLPDIPDTSWQEYQASLFKTATDAAISGLQGGPGYVDSSSPQAFVRGLLPIAQRWQGKTGIAASTWIAIAASESNWGKAGGNALFGIKGKGTAGSLSSPTWESVNGQRVNITDSFRTYHNPEESFQGFWDFVNENPRYAQAVKLLKDGHNSDAFVHAINQAGYATDPNWATSIRGIAASSIQPLIVQSLQKGQPQPTMGAQQPAPTPSPSPNDAWNQKQQAAFGQAVASPDTSAWASVQVPPATSQPSFRAHAQAKMDALGGVDATQYPAGTDPTAAGMVSGMAPLASVDAGPTSRASGDRASMAGAEPDPFLQQQQPPTDNANLKDFASYASSKIAALGTPDAATGSLAPLGYNDMAGASSTGSAPGFGSNPQDATSPIDRARAAGGSGLAGPDLSTVTNALAAPAKLERSMIAGPPDQPGGVAGAALTALPILNPLLGGAVNQARNVVRGYQQSDPNQPILNRVNQTLDIASQPFEQGLTKLGDQLGAYDPSGGAAGAVSLAGHLATDPLITTSPIGPYVLGGTVAGAIGGYGVSRAHGDTPEQTRANVENYGNYGMLAGGGLEGVAHVAGPAVGKLAGAVGPEARRLASEESGAIGLPGRTRSPQVPTPPAPPTPAPSPLAGPAVKDPLAAIHEMYNGPAPQAPPKSPTQVMKVAGDTFVRLMTDRGAPLANFQRDVAKTLGRPLRVNEMAAELSRLNPDMAARVKIQEGLQPALQGVGQENIPALSDYLTAKHNIDVASTLGQRTQTEALQVPLATTTAERQAQALNGRLRMYQRLRQDGVAAGDGTVVTHYDELIAATQADLATVNKRALRQVTAADAQRAAEAQAKGQAVTANRQFSGGINQNESQQALVQLQQVLGPQRFARVEQAAQQVWKFADGIRQQAVDAGLWTPELAAELRRDYPHYVPTEIKDYMQESGGIANGASLSVHDQGLKRLTIEGTDKTREDPLASLVKSQYQMEALAGKNRAFNAFVRLNERLPADERLIRAVPDSYTVKNYEAKVTGFIDGKKQTYVMPKEYETVVKQEANPPIRGVTTAMQLYKSLLTSKNPAFVAGQVPLDAMDYIIREATRGGGPQALPSVLKALFSAYADAWKGFGTQTFHGNTAEFLKGGGGMGGFFRNDSAAVRANVAELARPSPLTVTSAADIGRIVKDVLTLKPVEAIGERFELAPRVASMKLAQQRGASNLQAVINGRTVTMDFAQGGSLAKFINQFIPFFNVGMQGLATPARVIRDNPRAALGTFLTLLAAPTVAAEAWNRADPQRAKDYADVPNYIKDRSIVVMLPMPPPTDNQGERRPQYVEIRVRNFAPFVDLTRAAMQTALGENTRGWQDLTSGAINATSPISVDSPLGLFGGLVPPPLSTGVELAANKDFYRGSNIASKIGDERASGLSQAAASGIFNATGVNARPSQVEFATADLAGGAGQIARDVSNLGRPSQGTPQSIPLAGQVIRRFVGGSVGQRLQTAQSQRMSSAITPILREAGMYDISPVSDHIGKIPLSNDEQAIYQETASQYIDQLLPAIAASPAYQRKSPADRAAILQKAMDNARQLAREYTLTQVDRTAILDRIQAEQAQKAG